MSVQLIEKYDRKSNENINIFQLLCTLQSEEFKSQFGYSVATSKYPATVIFLDLG